MLATPLRITLTALSLLLLTSGFATRADAGKDHCRTIELSGAAGAASADQVELRVTDYLGNVVDQSCKLTVAQNECADALAKRLVANWGNGSSGGSQAGSCLNQALTTTCGKNLDLVPVSGGDTDAFRIFCKHKYKAGKVVGGKAAIEALELAGQCPQSPLPNATPTNGQFKMLPKVEVCCYELSEEFDLDTFNYSDLTLCKGGKLGKTLTTPQRVEVSVLDRVDHPNVGGDGIHFDPRDENDNPIIPVGDTSRQIALDPIGFHQTVSPKGASCRADLARAAYGLDATALAVLAKCHFAQQPGVNCNDIGQADQNGAIAAAVQALRQAAGANCEGPNPLLPRISPAVYGLRSCPAPCDAIPLGTCSAGLVGTPCSSDRKCDTAAGSGNGRCSNWNSAADCISCLQTASVRDAVQSVFNVSPMPVSPVAVQKCVGELAKSLEFLVSTFNKDMLSCQKRADAAKTAFADTFCKDTDPKGIRASAVEQVRSTITAQCASADLAGLPICSGNTTLTALGDCVVTAAKGVTKALSSAVFPETATVCGNAKLERGEQCDGSNDDAACDGLCNPDCTCPAPVCGNHVTEATEFCDGTSDMACPGACTASCQCGPPPPFIVQSLVPCEPAVTDRYRFKVNAGDIVTVRADTTDLSTAADLCFGPESGCDTGDAIDGDDEVPCSFPSPLGYGCPLDSFVASGGGTCSIEVTECIGDCANPSLANYQLIITRNGVPAAVQMLADNVQ